MMLCAGYFKPSGAVVALTIVENDAIDTDTLVPSTGSEKVTYLLPEELEVQLLR